MRMEEATSLPMSVLPKCDLSERKLTHRPCRLLCSHSCTSWSQPWFSHSEEARLSPTDVSDRLVSLAVMVWQVPSPLMSEYTATLKPERTQMEEAASLKPSATRS